MPSSPILEQHLAASWPAADWQDVSVLVAVSGGADSVALLRALVALKNRSENRFTQRGWEGDAPAEPRKLGGSLALPTVEGGFRIGSKRQGAGKLAVAHFNHRLRGAESDGDEQFVAGLSKDLQLPCLLGSSGPAAIESGGDGLEAAARKARYEFLQATAEKLGARYVVTAHTADDQAETVLQRVLRGTGIGGLAGIPRTRNLGPAVTLMRPLLEVRRSEIVDYLRTIGQPWREDHTNAQLHYQRNRIRHELIPILERDYNRAAVDALLRLAKLAADAQQAIDEQVSELLRVAVQCAGDGGAVVDCDALAGCPRHLVREMLLRLWSEQSWPLQSMGFEEWELLAEMALGAAAARTSIKRILPGNIEAQRKASQLSIRRLP